jgi:hypothetical protein
MVDQQKEPEPDTAPASSMTREREACLSPRAAAVVADNEVPKQSPPKLVDRNDKPTTTPKTLTNSSTLADLKREIRSSPRRNKHGYTSPQRRITIAQQTHQ